jgi:tellurite resistance protein
MEILDYDPEKDQQAIEAEFHRGVKGVMVRMMLADGVIDDEEVEQVRRIYGDLTGTQLSAASVHEEAKKVREGKVGIDAFLAAIAGAINDHGKEMIVKAAYLIAAADGEFQQEEKDMLGQVASALNMTSAHLSGVIESMNS